MTTIHPLQAEEIARARARSQHEGVTLTQALFAGRAHATPADTLASIAQALGYAVVQGEDLSGADFSVLPFADCLRRGLWAGRRADGRVLAVMACGFDAETEAWALRRWRHAGVPGELALAEPETVARALAACEKQQRASAELQPLADAEQADAVVADIDLAGIEAEPSAVVRFVHSTLYDALHQKASDLHFESAPDGLRVLFRLDGVLVPITVMAGREGAEQVVSRLKVMAELDISERRVPQDGRFKVRVTQRPVDFRVSVMPSIHGEDVVLRLLDRRSLTEGARSLCLDDLGLDAPAMAQVRGLAARPHGMLLVTGPTGSGKTTTLYAALTEIHTGQHKIVTIEDPVEYRLPQVLQIPVNERKGLSFARGLRSILRHDPDKIMVGEIRDDETAQIAVQAALTGHLVFTTVHANNVYDVLGRFLHMGVDAYSFAAALNGIVSQRLLRMNCTACRRPVAVDAAALQGLGLTDEQRQTARWQAGRGCEACRGTGYRGRRAVAEVLELDDAFKELIVAKAPLRQLKAQALSLGLRPLQTTALELALAGHTTLDEVLRVVG